MKFSIDKLNFKLTPRRWWEEGTNEYECDDRERKVIPLYKDTEGPATLREELNFALEVLNTVNALVVVYDNQGRIIFFNKTCEHLTGHTVKEAKGKHVWDVLFIPEDVEQVKAIFIAPQAGTFPGKHERHLIARDEKQRVISWSCSVICECDGSVRYNIGTGIDITERYMIEEKLRYFSMYDAITSLYNRAYFEEEMRRLEDGRNNPVGLIIIDLNGLKLVNDSLGHEAGDEMLRVTAKILRNSFREGDVVARIGGDEFAILLPRCSKQIVEEACQRIYSTIEAYNAEITACPLSISLGFAIKRNGKMSMHELFKEADNNMYCNKLQCSGKARSQMVQNLMRGLVEKNLINENYIKCLEALVTNLGLDLGLPSSNIHDLRLLARFHDIGKVYVPEPILVKPGPLTPEEVAKMQRHSEIGCSIARSAPELASIAHLILKHHEWWNGAGYPLGLKKIEIPLECRIVAIACAYQAMTSDRPYRKAMSNQDAVSELRRYAGIQFDPDLVTNIIQVLGTC